MRQMDFDYVAICAGCQPYPHGDAEYEKAVEGAKILWSNGHNEGYGHHGYETVFETPTGEYIVANCGGCSCEGSGSFSRHNTLKDAMQAVSEYNRDEKFNALGQS